MNFFVGVRLCNLVNETAPLPQFCVIFLNISLFREMMLGKNTKFCVIRRTHCLIVNGGQGLSGSINVCEMKETHAKRRA